MSNDDKKPDEIQSTFDADINRGGMTISQFMSKRGIEGGAGLDDRGSASSARELLKVREGQKYAVGEMVAKGGMGAILSAKDLNCGRKVAMKVMLNPRGASDVQLLRFIEEAKITAQLEHPSVVPVHELGVDAGDNVYYTMKLVQGLTLDDVLKGIAAGDFDMIAKYPLNSLLNVLMKTCDAVAFAHSKGVVHRDLKPENIMVGEYGEVLVMDWGLAKVLGGSGRPRTEASGASGKPPAPGGGALRSGSSRATAASIDSVRSDESGDVLKTMDGQILGTPTFMAPEQALGRIEEISFRTDIYALGAILYNILTLRPPVQAGNVQGVLLKVARGEVDPPEEALREVGAGGHLPGGRLPEGLSAVAMQALARRPEDRYASVKELQADAEAYLEGFATRAEEAGLGRLLALFIRRHKVEAGLALVGFAVVLALTVGFMLRLDAARGKAVAASNEALIAKGEAETALRKYREEQQARRELGLRAAREFRENAAHCLDTGNWEEAMAAMDVAVGLDPADRAGWHLRARLHLGEGEFAETWEAFIRAGCRDDPLAAIARKYSKLFAGGTPAPANERVAPGMEVDKAGDFAVAARLFGRSGNTMVALRARFRAVEQALQRLNPEVEKLCFIARIEPPAIGLDISRNRSLVNIEGLAGLPLTKLDLGGCGALTDISPLGGMQLNWLNLNGTQVSDISVLAGMPMKRLRLDRSRVSDLTPLAETELTYLDAGSTAVHDLSPLRGLPLKHLDLGATKIADLSPLTGMPLETLFVSTCERLHDLEPLRGMKLKDLGVHYTNISDISVLAGMPLVRFRAQFSKVADLTPLAGAPLTDIDLWDTPVSDIEPLRGMPLEELKLSGTKVADLSPVRGMPLKTLTINQTRVTDLSALAGMSLLRLKLERLRIHDLEVLRGMPLEWLDIRGTDMSDFNILRDMLLRSLEFDAKTPADISFLRDKPGLKKINRVPAAQFWRKWDAAEAKRRAE